MSAKTIDYDALAKQYGGVKTGVDYDALARQHGAISSTPPAGPQPNAQPGWMAQAAADLGIGAAKGFTNTALGVSRLLNKIPGVGEYLAPSEGIAAADQWKQPTNTAQKVGYYGEQAGEWLLPTGAEAKGALLAERLIPQAGKAAPIVAKIGAAALESGARNKLQGGGFTAGAVVGAGGSAIAQGAKAIAPNIADKALGIWKKDRTYGRTPGQAALVETTGISPSTIATQADAKLSQLDQSLSALAGGAQGQASTQSAINLIDAAMADAQAQNNASNYRKLHALREQLTTSFVTGQPLAATTPYDMLNLRRGVDDLVTSWNPQDTSKTVQGVIKQVRHALGSELHATAPGTAAVDKRISNLIPVAKRSDEVASSPGVVGDLIEKMRRPTGALVGSAVGGALGYQQGGAEGAAKGVAVGLAPTFLAQPGTLMAAARAANSPALNSTLIPFAKGLFLQPLRKPDGSVGYAIVRADEKP